MLSSPLPPRPSLSAERLRVPLWLWPHVLSLEAPAVAVIWAMALGGLHGVQFWPGVLSGLALAVWAIYLADRTIDTVGVQPEQLDLRHQVYRRYRGVVLTLLLPLCLAALGYLALWVVPEALMWRSVTLGMLMVLYLAVYSAAERPLLYLLLVALVCVAALVLVHSMPLTPQFKTTASVVIAGLMVLLLLQRTRQRLFVMIPKEVAGGLLFALGCTAWQRFIGTGTSVIGSLVEFVLMGALFTCNLTGISAKQREDEGLAHMKAMEYGHDGLLVGLIGICAMTLAAIQGQWVTERLGPLAWAAGSGAGLLALLHLLRRRLSVDAYRVWADIAVAVPALALIWLR